MRSALVNGRILTDDGFVDGRRVLIDGERIAAVVEADDRAHARARSATTSAAPLLLPGFIDAQVNGGGGVLFNDAPTRANRSARSARAHRRFGTTGFLPTLISDDLLGDRRARSPRCARRSTQACPGVLGVHIEGPFISEARKGAHDSGQVPRPRRRRGVRLLTSLGVGRTLVTLAPEMTTPASIARLAAAGVVVVGRPHQCDLRGHARGARRTALRGFTHLFNAMSPLTSREPGVVGRALCTTATAGAGSSSTGATCIRSCCSSRCAASAPTASCW